jgi:hypothetical protein
MTEKYFHTILGNDAGAGTAADPYKTYARARAMAGSDEVWGGGIGCGTWAKIRFCASDGDDANTGLTPDSPKYNFLSLWNSFGVLPDNYSVVILVKGNYSFTSDVMFTGGGRRSSSYCNTNKMLKGYTGSDYFGSGRFSVNLINNVTYIGFSLSGCDNSIFKNIEFYDAGGDFLISIGPSQNASYHVEIDSCVFYNSRFGVYGGTLLKDTMIRNCGFYGVMCPNGYAVSLVGTDCVHNCYISEYIFGIQGGISSGLILSNNILSQCTNGINANAANTLLCTNNVFYKNNVAIKVGDGSTINKKRQILNSIFDGNNKIE